MARKRKKRAIGDGSNTSKTSQNSSITHQGSDPENKSFDFGGIPERDLKKNLGCG
jgi:hypothetical protein